MNLEQFKELFNPLPGNHYIQVTSKVDDTTTTFYELMQSVGGELSLAYYHEQEEAPDLLALYPDAKIQYIPNLVHPFRALPRDHDMVILKDIFTQHHKQELLLNTAYKTLANTAHIIIMEKKGVLDTYATQELLERFEFRAPNTLDIVEGYDIVMGKKMHMWGNGL
jgi:hypothetical protein